MNKCRLVGQATTKKLIKGMQIGLLALCGGHFFANTAYAVYPCATGYTYIKGYCVKTGSVNCEMGLDKLGNVKTNTKSLRCSVEPVGDGILFCTNPGGNQPPAKIIIQQTVAPFANESPIKADQVTNSGAAHITLHVTPTAEQLFSLVQTYCPNNNYSADYVPIQMNGSMTLKDTKRSLILESLGITCTLPNPDTLGWDSQNQVPESREYVCETTSVSD